MTRADAGPIILVGAGRMGGALLEGWLQRGIGVSRIFILEPSPSAEMSALLQRSGLGISRPDELPKSPAVIVLAVKPQVMDEVAAAIAPIATPRTVVLSVAAGRTAASLAKHFGENAPIVRVMPNTPSSIGRGISALYATPAVKLEQARACEELMAAVGDTVWLDDERMIDAVTAVSGSGPAYVFLLTEYLARAGENAGLPADLAAKLARATVAGAGDLMRHSDQLSAAELRRNVTSPGGTTEAALNVLMGADDGSGQGAPLADLMREAVAAAAKRSRELAG